MILQTFIVKDFKGLKDLRLKGLRPGLIIFTGDNGQGKSSALDAFTQGLRGGKAVDAKPVRDGALEAEILMEFDNGLTVERHFYTGRDPVLKLHQKGKKHSAGTQATLNAMFEAVALDPTALDQRKPADQVAELTKALGLDLAKFDSDEEKAVEARKQAKRDADIARNHADSLPEHDDAPAAETTSTELAAQVTELQKAQAAVADAVRAHEAANQALHTARGKVDRMRQELAAAEKAVADTEAGVERLGASLRELPDPAALAGKFDALNAQLASLDANNAKFRANAAKLEAKAKADAAEALAERCENAVADVRARRMATIAAAKPPVPGTMITRDGIVVDGIPLEQRSQGERLRFWFEVSRRLAKDVKVICCREASNLDDKAVKFLADLAIEHGMQFILEMVRTNDENAIELREGTQVRS